MTQIKRIGFGQVEPNHLSAQRTGQIYAQLPANADMELLENGQFVKYDYLNKEVNLTGEGEWMMVFNEVKLYDDRWRESYKDFAMIRKNYVDEEMVPRLFKTNIGDIYTTNCVGAANEGGKIEYDGIEIAAGDVLSPDTATGYLVVGEGDICFQVVADDVTMPDGQPAVKVMRIK